MKVTCVVDNTASRSSGFWGEHGLAFLIETRGGDRLLFDTGRSGKVLLHNLDILGVEPEAINALAISHAHYDHTGGLPALLEHVAGIPLYAHPDLSRQRFSRREGKPESVGLPMSFEALREKASLHLSTSPQEVLTGVWTTGEITPRPEPEGRSPYHLIREGESWAPDPYSDDMALVLETAKGLVVICGCCHAGLLNTLACVRRIFGTDIAAVIGGTHLISADEAHLKRVIEALRELRVPRLYPNHCTGERAYIALVQALGERVAPCPAGCTLDF